MSKEANARVAKWLNDRFLDLQRDSGRRWTVTELAEYLDCPQSLVSRWLIGKGSPGRKYIPNLARLGDDIYDIVGLPRPDPDLRYIAANWERAPVKLRKAARRLFERGLGKGD